MTSRERILRMFRHEEADRIPIADKPWGQDTIERWKKDGMPANVAYEDYFGFDKIIRFDIDNSPRFEKKTLEETPEYRIYTTVWGETRKSWQHITSTPQSLEFIVKTPDDWRLAKARMAPDRDRIQWAYLSNNYKRWRAEGSFIMPSIASASIIAGVRYLSARSKARIVRSYISCTVAGASTMVR